MALGAALAFMLLMPGCAQVPDAPGAPIGDGGWRATDVGGSAGGRTEITGSEFRLEGSGDVAFDVDRFHFAFQTITGDGAIQARLVQHSGSDVGGGYWPKAGIMVRAGLQPGAPNALLFLVENDSFEGAVFQERRTPYGETSVIGARSGVLAPRWLRLEREGSSVRALTSNDGEAWTMVGTAAISVGQDVLIGLAVASGDLDGGAMLEGVFDTVTVEALDVHPPAPVPPVPPGPAPGPPTSATYEIDATTNFLNPERGWHQEVNLLARTGFSSVRSSGSTLARNYIRLDSYRYSDLPASVLNDLAAGLAEARTHGIKIILRFSYNFGFEPDAPLDSVLNHIGQLAPILREYEDVLVVLQAGFIGAWGEWHASTHGLNAIGNKRAITDALLDALPETRMIQIRTPWHIRDVVGSPDPGLDRFSAQPQARIGFKNDCFVSSSDDAGTYGGDQVLDRAEGATLSQYTVMGGETCEIAYPNPRNGCDAALRELAEFHWDYLNANWYNPVTNRWRSEGCYDEITRRLGYRLSLTEGSVSSTIGPGGTISVQLTMLNTGFGKVFNPRPIEIVLRNVATGLERTLRVTADGRAALPLGGETRVLLLDAAVPADLPAGEYRVLLNLPDPAPTLWNDPRHSIRLANIGTWEEATGYNDLLLTTSLRR